MSVSLCTQASPSRRGPRVYLPSRLSHLAGVLVDMVAKLRSEGGRQGLFQLLLVQVIVLESQVRES